ncbi:MAG TPA: hypothetical protein VMM36_15970 [Opitutaceae bacterium]|nr:hypothetical protein [Opitutaceae bacterium]
MIQSRPGQLVTYYVTNTPWSFPKPVCNVLRYKLVAGAIRERGTRIVIVRIGVLFASICVLDRRS